MKYSKKIGKQEWTTLNLNVVVFSNGDPINEIKTKEEWIIANKEGRPGWCFYNNDKENEQIYGRLYNWYAVTDERGICPKGWHIPSDNEWGELIESIGGYKKAGKLMKSNSLWQESCNLGNNQSEFNVFPSGYRNFYGDFFFLQQHAYFWSKTEHYNHLAWYHTMDFMTDEVLRYYNVKGNGFPCRCIRD